MREWPQIANTHGDNDKQRWNFILVARVRNDPLHGLPAREKHTILYCSADATTWK